MATVATCGYDLNYTICHQFCNDTRSSYLICGSSLSKLVAAILTILLLISVTIHMVVVVFYCCKKRCRLQKVQSDLIQQNHE
jgi:hypothetical protein